MKHAAYLMTLATLAVGAVHAQTSPTALGKSTSAVSANPIQVNINTATAQQLMTLPGIGPKTSAMILKNRPFKNKADLLNRVSRIGPMQWAKISSHVLF